MCDHCGCGVPGARTIPVGEDVLAHERAHAESLRRRLEDSDSRLVNVIGSPGCGKTELIAALLPGLTARGVSCAVVEGDLATDNDARRIAAAGAPVHQVTTGTACHLTAHDVEHALEHLEPPPRSLIVVENVGNLVCPSMFDLGEALRIVCLSVTEGTDKPQKYPVTFREAGLVLITKSDLGPHVDFDVDAATGMIRDLSPETPTLVLSARSGDGLDELVDRVASLWND